ncbi:MAG TPA: hypothetical protein PLO51_06235, partial [Candidatus Micrarchaeota archaeon]|nr:hypothetical protein [Candidatus Micrarchaeota archaeon]
ETLLRSNVKEAIELSLANAVKKGIELKNEVSRDLRLSVDVDLLDLILTNLISNSVKYTPKGGSITISAAVKDSGFAT